MTYGLHGTPEPDQIDKTQSHGCVRMTYWDARELAAMVEQGTVVEFRRRRLTMPTQMLLVKWLH